MDHAVAGGSASGDDKKQEVQLLSISWNQDSSCFVAATTADVRVFNCHPFHETIRRIRHDGSGGFAAAEMLFRSNFFATVPCSSSGGEDGAGRDQFTVEVWNDVAQRLVWHHAHPAAVRGVKLSWDRIAVADDRAVTVYNLFNPARVFCRVQTAPNPRGLCCLACHPDDESAVLACPGAVPGQVRVEHLGKDRYATCSTVIRAHGSDVACMAMNLDGTVLATASVKGTLIRVFSTEEGTCLQEVRRGRDHAEVYSIALSKDLQWLAVSSNKGTVHVFSLRITGAGNVDDAAGGVPSSADSSDPVEQANPNAVSNARSSLSFMKGFLPNYFTSEWSFAQFRLPQVTRCIVAFGKQNTVMILGMDARCSFDPVKGGEMVRKEYYRFLKGKNKDTVIQILTAR